MKVFLAIFFLMLLSGCVTKDELNKSIDKKLIPAIDDAKNETIKLKKNIVKESQKKQNATRQLKAEIINLKYIINMQKREDIARNKIRQIEQLAYNKEVLSQQKEFQVFIINSLNMSKAETLRAIENLEIKYKKEITIKNTQIKNIYVSVRNSIWKQEHDSKSKIEKLNIEKEKYKSTDNKVKVNEIAKVQEQLGKSLKQGEKILSEIAKIKTNALQINLFSDAKQTIN